MHQVANGEVRGVALSVVAVLFTGLEGFHVGRGNGFGAVAQPLQRAMHQLFMLPGEAAEQQRGVGPLAGGERLLHRLLEMVGFAFDNARFVFQASALFGQAPLIFIG